MKKKQHVEIGNCAWLLYLCYIILILLVECADLLCYSVGLPQVTILSRGIVVACFGFFLLFARDKICVLTPSKSKLTWIIFLFFIVIGVLKGITPDTSLDVTSYHMLAQTPGFLDAFDFHFAPGDFQMFGFRLPDRLFYLFRIILGFRMGTLLNSLVLFLIYLQVRDILVITLGDTFSQLRGKAAGWTDTLLSRILFNEGIIALVIVLTHDACMQFGSYMVDMFAIPVMLEMLRILLKKENAEKSECAYYAFLAGLTFCMKMTNIVYMVPLLICFLVKNRKQLTVPLFMGCFVLAILPVSIYLFYNFLETGNPVFPYYNEIFQSEYFPVTNFKDTRWGFSSFKEFVLWPFYMVFRPEYRLSEIPNNWALGGLGMFAAAVWFVLNTLKNKKIISCCAPVHIVFIGSYFLWAYTTGHIRYFLFGYILGGIMLVELVVTALTSWKQWSWKTVTVALALLFAIGPLKYLPNIIEGREWSWRPVTATEIKANLKYVLNDYNPATEEQKKKIDVFLMNDNKSTGSVAHQINPDVPIIFNSYVRGRLNASQIDAVQDRIDQYFKNGLGVYDVYYAGGISFDNQIANMDAFGVKLISCEWLNNTYPGTDSFILMELDALQGGEQNICRYANKDTENQIALSRTADTLSMTVHAGYTVNFGWYPQENVYLQVKITDDRNHELVSVYPVKEGEFYTFQLSQDLSQFSNGITVDYRLVHGDGSLFDVNGPNPFAVLTYDIAGAEMVSE